MEVIIETAKGQNSQYRPQDLKTGVLYVCTHSPTSEHIAEGDIVIPMTSLQGNAFIMRVHNQKVVQPHQIDRYIRFEICPSTTRVTFKNKEV